MPVGGNGIDIIGMYTLAAILNFAGVLWSAGIAIRLRTTQGAPLMQTPVFLALFLAPVYVPLALLEGWIHGVATGNPITYLLESGRGFLSGKPSVVLLAFACGAGSARSSWSGRSSACAAPSGPQAEPTCGSGSKSVKIPQSNSEEVHMKHSSSQAAVPDPARAGAHGRPGCAGLVRALQGPVRRASGRSSAAAASPWSRSTSRRTLNKMISEMPFATFSEVTAELYVEGDKGFRQFQDAMQAMMGAAASA